MTENKVKEVQTVYISLKNGTKVELDILFDTDANAFFAVETSFIEQEVGNVYSPYNGTELTFMD